MNNQFFQAAQAAKEAEARAAAAEEKALAEAEAAAAAAEAAVFHLPDSHPAPVKLTLWQRITNSGSSFLILSIAFHVLLLLGAAVYVVQTIHAKEKVQFSAKKPGSSGPKAAEFKVQTAKQKQNMASAPAVSTKLTTTASNVKVAIPEAPPVMGATTGMPAMGVGR